MASPPHLPSPARSLSARLLVLTVGFVLLGEILIYVPSIARFRAVYLDERIAAAHLATLSLEAAGDTGIDRELEDELLSHAGVLSVTLREPAAELMLGRLPPVENVVDLRASNPLAMIGAAFDTLRHGGDRTIRVIGPSPQRPAVLVDISLHERALWNAMVNYSWRILSLSIVISLITAVLVYAALQLMMVRPLRRVTDSVIAFRRRPEDASTGLPPSQRGDEIGLVQTELSRMQEGLRVALAQKTRLAALGGAVSKINHDLRNLLANAMLLSDRLEQSHDPEVRHVAPRLVEAMDRAARLCSETLNFARAEVVEPRKTRFPLAPLIDEVGLAVVGPDQIRLHWRNEARPDLMLHADRDQLFRVLMNLGRNAAQALAEGGGLISVAAWPSGDDVVIELADTGQGIPNAAQAHLFEAFSGSARPGGTGLGLPIAREIMRAHGGDVELAHTGAEGTVFRLTLPCR
ncbi:MAG: yycG [Geminicoccaceae bacterium]|nr:yycG [Geminicoccaceae bacterium]